ncbi:mediator of RNA polymerase II transcription subunit 13 [Trichonephila clavipes]|nr:mediator of RNA polymerase II transcription subunit 13 [Trichonephila clavipes]
MTHPNFVTNGASLEDCHTNFFALADLCGIKWRRYYTEIVLCYEPLDDPVLLSFSKCCAANILCVWRRVASQGHEQHRHNLQDGNQLNYKKELWVFWYGEEPDFTGLVSPDLIKTAGRTVTRHMSDELSEILMYFVHNQAFILHKTIQNIDGQHIKATEWSWSRTRGRRRVCRVMGLNPGATKKTGAREVCRGSKSAHWRSVES